MSGIDAPIARGSMTRDDSTPEKRDIWAAIERVAARLHCRTCTCNTAPIVSALPPRGTPDGGDA